MSKINNCFMGILSCEKYESRRNSQNLKGSIFDYMYFIGNPNLDEPNINGNIVSLPCGDGYEHLPKKTNLMVKWIIENKPNVEYIFKTDDDISFDFPKLFENFHTTHINHWDYSGNMVIVKESESFYHFGKCEGEINETAITIQNAEYCSGGGYFISKKSAEIIINNFPNDNIIFEDHYVGRTLNDNGIYPKHINLLNNSCFW